MGITRVIPAIPEWDDPPGNANNPPGCGRTWEYGNYSKTSINPVRGCVVCSPGFLTPGNTAPR